MTKLTDGPRNLDAFCGYLTAQYADLFKSDPDYASVSTRTTPADLARKMTLALSAGTANKDGKAIKAACAHFGLPHTYKAIRAFFDADIVNAEVSR